MAQKNICLFIIPQIGNFSSGWKCFVTIFVLTEETKIFYNKSDPKGRDAKEAMP